MPTAQLFLCPFYTALPLLPGFETWLAKVGLRAVSFDFLKVVGGISTRRSLEALVEASCIWRYADNDDQLCRSAQRAIR